VPQGTRSIVRDARGARLDASGLPADLPHRDGVWVVLVEATSQRDRRDDAALFACTTASMTLGKTLTPDEVARWLPRA
jgi:hypothetical protein